MLLWLSWAHTAATPSTCTHKAQLPWASARGLLWPLKFGTSNYNHSCFPSQQPILPHPCLVHGTVVSTSQSAVRSLYLRLLPSLLASKHPSA